MLEAAGKLHITQAALTLAIQALEDNLGVLLFDRLPTGIRITPKGRALYTRLSRQVETTNKEIALALEHADDSPIKFGAASPFYRRVLLPAVDAAATSERTVLFQRPSSSLYSSVAEGLIDFAFINGAVEPKGPLKWIKLTPLTGAVVGLKKKMGIWQRSKIFQNFANTLG